MYIVLPSILKHTMKSFKQGYVLCWILTPTVCTHCHNFHHYVLSIFFSQKQSTMQLCDYVTINNVAIASSVSCILLIYADGMAIGKQK